MTFLACVHVHIKEIIKKRDDNLKDMLSVNIEYCANYSTKLDKIILIKKYKACLFPLIERKRKF